MAIYLSRNFRSCSSFAFVSRRNSHSNSLVLKATNPASTFVKEMSVLDHPPLSLPRNCEVLSSKAVTNSPVYFDSLFCAQECKAYKNVSKEPEDNLKRADRAQLRHVSNILIEDLPQLFSKNMNYKIYHPNMVFENNIRGTKTVGLVNYMREMFILKIIGNIRFSHVKFKILKITEHPEDGTVRVRWRIVGVSQLKNILSMIKQTSQKYSEPEGWYDGFSIFYVRSDGLIHRHIVDKMIPENYDGEKIVNLRNPLAAKMAFAVGVSIKDFPLPEVLFDEMPPLCEEKRSYPSKVIYSMEVKRPTSKMKLSDSCTYK